MKEIMKIARCLLPLMILMVSMGLKAQEKTLVEGLNPMESVVKKACQGHVIVRNDESRRNVFTLRSDKTMALAFDRKFEKFLDIYEVDGMPFLAFAAWNPAFDYLWSAWAMFDGKWREILSQPIKELRIVIEEGRPSLLECKDMNGDDITYSFQDLIAPFLDDGSK